MQNAHQIDHCEALADAITSYLGWSPGSRSNRNRNPGLLRGPSLASSMDADGYAVFSSLPVGYQALLDFLRREIVKSRARSEHAERTLLDLCTLLAPDEDPGGALLFAAFCAQWMTRALQVRVTWLSLLRDINAADNATGSNGSAN